MDKIIGLRNLIKLQGQQCSCFPQINKIDEQFLSKHKTSEIISPKNSNKINNIPSNTTNNKFHQKKSLKKPLHPFQAKKKKDFQQSHLYETQDKEASSYCISSFSNQANKLDYSCNKLAPQINKTNIKEIKSLQKIKVPSIEGNSPPIYNKPINFDLESKITNISFFPSSPMQKKYSSPISHQHLMNSEKANDFIKPAFFSCKTIKFDQNHEQKIEQNIPNKINNTSSLQKLNQQYRDEYSSMVISLNDEQIDARIKQQQQALKQTPKRLITKSSLDIMTKVSQIGQLKKMQDVIEIYSQADSQNSDSDNQSIVLGRLNQYYSMVQPKYDGASTIQKSIKSKFEGTNAISSSISYSHFNHKKHQF